MHGAYVGNVPTFMFSVQSTQHFAAALAKFAEEKAESNLKTLRKICHHFLSENLQFLSEIDQLRLNKKFFAEEFFCLSLPPARAEELNQF